MAETPKVRDYANLPAPQGYQSFVKDIGPLALDHYALTMTLGAWKLGFADNKVTTSNVFCRSLLNNGDSYTDTSSGDSQNIKIPYLVNAGAGLVGEWMDGWKWGDRELRFLAQQKSKNAKGEFVRVFPNEFLAWLERQKLSLNIKAIPEGQLIYPQEPSMQLNGLWWQQMLVEAMTLELISSSTNLATVASQVRMAATREAATEGKVVVEASAKEYASLAEMALRRSSSIGAIQSARAANMTGWDSTSNDYAGMCYDILVMGTFAHAWVMLHDTEEEAFENWAKAFPDSAVFLVDTYDTLEGVKKAIAISKKCNLDLKGIRLDSGNLAYLSVETRKLLNESGYQNTRILATDSVTVKNAVTLFNQAGSEATSRKSEVNSFGVGSTVAVNRDNPLLDFVMKLCAQHEISADGKGEKIRELLKLSESVKKTTLPGVIDVVRFINAQGHWAGDTIIPATLDIGTDRLVRDLYSAHTETGAIMPFPKGAPFIRLLQPWMNNGKMVDQTYIDRDAPAILREAKRSYQENIAKMDSSHLILPPGMPHKYGVGIAQELSDKRASAVSRIRAQKAMAAQRMAFGLVA